MVLKAQRKQRSKEKYLSTSQTAQYEWFQLLFQHLIEENPEFILKLAVSPCEM